MDHYLVQKGVNDMQVSLTEAKAQLTDLARRAEAGEEIILTRHGQPAVKLVPIQRKRTAEEKRALLDALREAGKHATPGPSAARSQDFLYDDDGLPY
jgi:prevent-host-death family protein